MAILKHIASKSSNYGAALKYLVFEHDELYKVPVRDEKGNCIMRKEFYIAGLNCEPYSFDAACQQLTYVLLLDRMTLSQKNGWVDVQGRAYVLYPLAGLAEDLQSSISSVTRALRELEAARLIERRSNGFSKPNQVFLSFPSTAQKCTVEMVKNEQPDCSKVSNTIAQNCTPNQINKNNLRLNQLSRTKEAYGRYRNVYLEDYSELKMEIAELDSLIDDLSIYMQSTGKKYADHAATLRSWSARKRKQQKPGTGIPDYTYNKEESL